MSSGTRVVAVRKPNRGCTVTEPNGPALTVAALRFSVQLARSETSSPGRAAPTVYTVEIPVVTGELVPENNSRSVLVLPPARPRRVLLVEGAPGFEHSFLKRSLGVDPGLQIDSIVRKGKNEEGNDTFYIQAAKSRSDSLTSGYPQQVEALLAPEQRGLRRAGQRREHRNEALDRLVVAVQLRKRGAQVGAHLDGVRIEFQDLPVFADGQPIIPALLCGKSVAEKLLGVGSLRAGDTGGDEEYRDNPHRFHHSASA